MKLEELTMDYQLSVVKPSNLEDAEDSEKTELETMVLLVYLK